MRGGPGFFDAETAGKRISGLDLSEEAGILLFLGEVASKPSVKFSLENEAEVWGYKSRLYELLFQQVPEGWSVVENVSILPAPGSKLPGFNSWGFDFAILNSDDEIVVLVDYPWRQDSCRMLRQREAVNVVNKSEELYTFTTWSAKEGVCARKVEKLCLYQEEVSLDVLISMVVKPLTCSPLVQKFLDYVNNVEAPKKLVFKTAMEFYVGLDESQKEALVSLAERCRSAVALVPTEKKESYRALTAGKKELDPEVERHLSERLSRLLAEGVGEGEVPARPTGPR